MSNRSSPVMKEPLGKLCYRPDDLDSLKCLVAVRMTRQQIVAEPLGRKKNQRTSFALADGSATLTDSFAISWFLSSYDHKASKTPDNFGAHVMQWQSFSVSEIKPFLTGIVREGHVRRRDLVRACTMRKIRLIQALDTLNRKLMDNRFLIGMKMTLADVIVAVDLMPLWDQDWMPGGQNLFLKDIRRKEYAFIDEWLRLVTSKASYVNAKKQLMSGVTPRLMEELVDNLEIKKKHESKRRVNKKMEEVDMTKLVEKPLRILCLHGYRQNETSFREKLGAFRKLTGKYVQFTFITAPHHVLPMSNKDINQDQRGWWFSQPNDYFKADDISDCDKGFEESLELIENTFKLHGPFNGVLGFSQGASLAALLCLIKTHKPERLSPAVKFDFAVFFACFKSVSSKHAQWYPKEGPKCSIPTLHVIGSDDRVIRRQVSEEMFTYFKDPEGLYHSGGHFVPSTSKQKGPYYRFLHRAHSVCYPVEETDEPSDSEPLKQPDLNQNKVNSDPVENGDQQSTAVL